MTDPYQLFEAVPDAAYQALKADIASRGVLVPVEVDEHGNVLDGHHRLRAVRELQIKSYPRVVRAGLSETEKLLHVRALNLLRRHLTRADRAYTSGSSTSAGGRRGGSPGRPASATRPSAGT